MKFDVRIRGYELGEPRIYRDEALNKMPSIRALKATFRILQREEGGKVKQIADRTFNLRHSADDGQRHLCDHGAERVVVSQLHRSPGVIFGR